MATPPASESGLSWIVGPGWRSATPVQRVAFVAGIAVFRDAEEHVRFDHDAIGRERSDGAGLKPEEQAGEAEHHDLRQDEAERCRPLARDQHRIEHAEHEQRVEAERALEDRPPDAARVEPVGQGDRHVTSTTRGSAPEVIRLEHEILE
jgi:hypothetical protein